MSSIKFHWVQNLKNFCISRPPLVISLINLFVIAFGLMFLSFWIQYNDLQNPDATKDWNLFLERFASMEICLTGNQTFPFMRRLSAFTFDGTHAIDMPLQSTPFPKLATHRTMIGIDIDEGLQTKLRGSLLIGALNGKLLGLRGNLGALNINITVVIPPKKVSTKSVCVELVGPVDFFPKTQIPPVCYNAKFNQLRESYKGLKPVSDLHYSFMYIYKTSYWSSLTYYCEGGNKLKLKYKFNPEITKMLSSEEKYIAEENLSHTAYTACILIVVMIVYGMVSGGRNPRYRLLSNSDVWDDRIHPEIDLPQRIPPLVLETI